MHIVTSRGVDIQNTLRERLHMSAAQESHVRVDSSKCFVREPLLATTIRWILQATEPRAGRSLLDASGEQCRSNMQRVQIASALSKSMNTSRDSPALTVESRDQAFLHTLWQRSVRQPLVPAATE